MSRDRTALSAALAYAATTDTERAWLMSTIDAYAVATCAHNAAFVAWQLVGRPTAGPAWHMWRLCEDLPNGPCASWLQWHHDRGIDAPAIAGLATTHESTPS